MTEKGYGGGLVSRIKNQHSGQEYVISTAQEIGKDYWSTVVMNSKFFGLWADMYHPLYTLIRNSKEDAHSVHAVVKDVVGAMLEKDWVESFPRPGPDDGYSKDAKAKLKEVGVNIEDLECHVELEEVEAIVHAYGKVVEEVCKETKTKFPAFVFPESLLPYPRVKIEKALDLATTFINDDNMRATLQSSKPLLDCFINDDEADRKNEEVRNKL